MRIKVAFLAIAGLLLFAGVAGAHKLPFGVGKTEIKRFTAAVCAGAEGCKNWSVGPCRRRSFHRIDCVSTIYSNEGGSCAWVTIARVPSNSTEVQIHHKRILC
jgi:hypothetical protein